MHSISFIIIIMLYSIVIQGLASTFDLLICYNYPMDKNPAKGCRNLYKFAQGILTCGHFNL